MGVRHFSMYIAMIAILAMSACSTLLGLDSPEQRVDAAPSEVPIDAPPSSPVTIRIANAGDDAHENVGENSEFTRSGITVAFGVHDIAALRFRNLPVPPGAMIDEAYIQFAVYDPDQTTDQMDELEVEIRAENADNCPSFVAQNPPSNRTRTDTFVLWTIPPWSGDTDRTTDQRTSDLSPLLQNIIDREFWQTKNAVGFFFLLVDDQLPDARRDAYSHNTSPALSAELTVHWTVVE